MTDAVLDRWQMRATGAGPVEVLPDGCRDLIVIETPGAAPRWLLSPLDTVPRLVTVVPGQRFTGLRLRPGAVMEGGFDPRLMRDPHEAAAAFHVPPLVAEALEALAEPGPEGRARLLRGTSLRSVERLLSGATGRPPGFWRRLARLRRAARAVAAGTPLAAAAADHGYADQPHMTREFRRWLGRSPGMVARENLPALWHSGYGDGAGVQISTSVPSGART